MKRIPRKLAGRILSGGIVLEGCILLVYALIPRARVACGFLSLILALGMLPVLFLTDLRCPRCGCVVRPGDHYCSHCGVKWEE